MDFEDTPEEAEFRREVRAWLADNAPRDLPSSKGDTGLAEGPYLTACKAWQAKKAEAGYAAITWPQAFGGRDGKPIEEVIFAQESAPYSPPDAAFSIGLGMCIPVLMAHGAPEHHERYVQPALRGEEIWCQLFSEPAAGSDVAGILTKAERDGDDWVVNGQKIWTSGALASDFGLLITRTDPNVPKHRGLTMFFLDMKSPGVEVRPVRQADGGAEFCEVFFTDVRIPDHQRLGDVGDGWKVTLTTLMHERQSVGGQTFGLEPNTLLDLLRKIEIDGEPAVQDPAVRDKLADWFVDYRGLEFTYFRGLTALSKGGVPGPEQSIQKVVKTGASQQMSYFALDLLAEAGGLGPEALGPEFDPIYRGWWWNAALRIAGGSDEILKNIIAERVLGLPGDVRLDKGIPFNEIK